ncbi:hypothetical protein [Bacteroides acidifaciens]|jgi:hypothetical protein|uniref:hypothetical protein n=1 Tax=Bacteroides acidifaciens TaxID=85831 RepID=UPI00242CBCCE|nr:hypothetical protein [Bacteroides acidifaciens]
MVDMDENDINNPANCFVEELKEANPNNISVPICGAKILEDNEKIAQDLSNRDKSADIFLKQVYGWGILVILAGWEIFVIIFSIIQLNPCDKCVYKVSDTVFVALLTTATANILALPAIILSYLFPKK